MFNSFKELESLLVFDKALLVHSTSVVLDGGGFLFSGNSGSGKTTLSKKMGDFFPIIHDDRNLLIFEDEKIELVVPEFLQKLKTHHYIQNNNLKAPLKRFFILKQEFVKNSYIQKIENRDVLWEFLFKVSPMPQKKELLKNYYALIDRLSKELDAFHFFHNLKDSAIKISEIIRK